LKWREYRLGYQVYLILLIVILLFSLIAMILSKKKKTNDEVLVPEEDLEKFIRRSFKKNHTEKALRLVLKNAGWPNKLIELTIQKIKTEPEEKLFGLISTGKIQTVEQKIVDEFTGILKQHKHLKTKIEDLAKQVYLFKRREDEFVKAKSEVNSNGKVVVKSSDDRLPGDVKKVLLKVDDMLESLPEEKIEEFANSDDFDLYEKVMKDFAGVNHEVEKNNNDSGKHMAQVVKLVANNVITENEARKMLGLPEQKPKPQIIIKEVPKIVEKIVEVPVYVDKKKKSISNSKEEDLSEIKRDIEKKLKGR